MTIHNWRATDLNSDDFFDAIDDLKPWEPLMMPITFQPLLEKYYEDTVFTDYTIMMDMTGFPPIGGFMMVWVEDESTKTLDKNQEIR